MAMLKPRRLLQGDRVAIVAPASPFDPEAFERGLAELRRLGYEPAWSERVFDRAGYLAGDARARAAEIEAAWRDPAIGAVLAARGGYGSMQVLPHLGVGAAVSARRAFVGHSDLTSILTWLTCHCGLACFHGPHVAGGLAGGRGGYDEDSFVRSISSPAPLGPLSAPGLEALRPGEARGVLAGGNLTLLAASLGTPFAFAPPDGAVLVFDEVGERPYRLDRLLTQLRLGRVLERASALVFNELPGCDEPGGTPAARSVVADVLRDFRGPILFGLPFGHTHGPCLTVPLGVQARVVAAPSPLLVIEEAAVA